MTFFDNQAIPPRGEVSQERPDDGDGQQSRGRNSRNAAPQQRRTANRTSERKAGNNHGDRKFRVEKKPFSSRSSFQKFSGTSSNAPYHNSPNTPKSNSTGGYNNRGRNADSYNRGANKKGATRRDINTGDNRFRSKNSAPSLSGETRYETKLPRTRKEPVIPDGIDVRDLDVQLYNELLTLDKLNAQKVAQHLLATQYFLEDDPKISLEHARAAKNRAGRIGSVRQILGIVAYLNELWNESMSELKAARRITGSDETVHLIADCQRGLGQPEKAIEFIRSLQLAKLPKDIAIELRIVESGAYRDLHQFEMALEVLQIPELYQQVQGTIGARLAYAYAEVLLAQEHVEEAIVWFTTSMQADPEATDAHERIHQLHNTLNSSSAGHADHSCEVILPSDNIPVTNADCAELQTLELSCVSDDTDVAAERLPGKIEDSDPSWIVEQE